MRSMLRQGSPASRVMATARSTSATVCRRPMAARTASCMVWGFTDTRSTPQRTITASFSSVTVSGRPASTVRSVQPDRSKEASSAASS